MPDTDPENSDELVAAALKAHRALSRGLGESVPVTALGPDGALRGLAAFIAVYAARRDQPDQPDQQDQQDRQDRQDREDRQDHRDLREAA
ncbi:hypothetical protein ACVB8X_23990 [Streptomyces sp. NRAIS4]